MDHFILLLFHCSLKIFVIVWTQIRDCKLWTVTIVLDLFVIEKQTRHQKQILFFQKNDGKSEKTCAKELPRYRSVNFRFEYSMPFSVWYLIILRGCIHLLEFFFDFSLSVSLLNDFLTRSGWNFCTDLYVSEDSLSIGTKKNSEIFRINFFRMTNYLSVLKSTQQQKIVQEEFQIRRSKVDSSLV